MPEDNNTSNNSSQGVAWYVKPTSDTIDFIKGIPVNVLANPDNVKFFDNYVKIKSGGLNMVIPIALMRLLGKKSGTRLSQGELVMWCKTWLLVLWLLVRMSLSLV